MEWKLVMAVAFFFNFVVYACALFVGLILVRSYEQSVQAVGIQWSEPQELWIGLLLAVVGAVGFALTVLA